MRGLQLVRPGAFSKTHDAVSSFLRNTSCNHGWLRVVVQYTFAVIIVASFILIVYMAIQNPASSRPPVSQESRCRINNCRVSCAQTPLYEQYSNHIINALMEVDSVCSRITLALINPKFINGSLPVSWTAGLSVHFHELIISGGNLVHIPPDAFMSQYSGSITSLTFHDITIRTWLPDSLVGLSSLKKINIKDSSIVNMQAGAIVAVDDTLEILTISGSGKWEPTNLTGSSNLVKIATVDFSGNYFHDVLNRNSFTGIQNCKVLYLNSCRISAIGSGTFDYFRDIKMLFLNNNFLVTIPDGLFTNMLKIEPHPRINLQENSWYCNCGSTDMKQLVSKDVLVIDPVCKYPVHFEGKTFSEFQTYCDNDTSFKIFDITLKNVDETSGYVYLNDNCYNGNDTSILLTSRMLSSEYSHRCSSQLMFGINLNQIILNTTKIMDQVPSENSWLQFTFFLQTDSYSIVQVGSSGVTNRGILWYESTCPNEIYCIDTVPKFLRVYNFQLSAQYVFCPILLNTGEVENSKCVTYNLSTVADILTVYSKFQVLWYIITVIFCLVIGAICVYALIRRNPTLLKGSKRIVFVKHKTVDALVLPPKVPMRNDLLNDPVPECYYDKIFVVPNTQFLNANFYRQKSTRSDKSYAPSYVSAHQPTEDQLAEWRIKHHFDNDLSITIGSEISSYSWITTENPTSNTTTLQYFSLGAESDEVYESLK